MPPSAVKPPSNSDLCKSLRRYTSLLKARQDARQATGANKDLTKLDAFIWSELSSRFGVHGKEGKKTNRQKSSLSATERWLTLAELKEVMRYKLARGKFRPTLPGLIASNSEDDVKSATEKAIQTLGAEDGAETSAADALAALKALTKLRGVGPATASLILSIVSPSSEGFQSDESWACLSEVASRKLSYSEADWKRWRQAFQDRLQQWLVSDEPPPNSETAACDMEKAMWAYVVGGGSTKETEQLEVNDMQPNEGTDNVGEGASTGDKRVKRSVSGARAKKQKVS